MRNTIIVLSLLSFAVNGIGQGKGKGKGKSSQSYSSTAVGVSFVFTDTNRRVISDWVRVQPLNGLPPGLRKGSLPPGLQKHLARNGTLPPGLQKKLSPFPVELVRRLPPPPPSGDYLVLDGQALLVNRGTNVIIDIVAVF
jgi:hypothetical protein